MRLDLAGNIGLNLAQWKQIMSEFQFYQWVIDQFLLFKLGQL